MELDYGVMSKIKYCPFVISSVLSTSATNIKIFKYQAVTIKRETEEGVLVKGLLQDKDFDILERPLVVKAGEYFITKGLDISEALISRAYTPVLRDEELKKGTFTVIVSLIENGKMSQFLEKLIPGDIVFWRGPYREFKYDQNSFKTLLLFGGGTGIVPLYNIAKSITENDKEETRVSLFCSFKTVDHVILRDQINRLMDYWNFKFKIFISLQSESTDFKIKYNEPILFKRIDESVINEELNLHKNGEFFAIVSGPEVFNTAIESYLLQYGMQSNNIFIFRYLLLLFSLTLFLVLR
ncbi:hypothetical protein RUM44_004219 [Polyplax serrata]|uniref:FAD-binding FR-type domain-containing protein n=1 Tax=Polyplax serrata TaxID=468196 RepID=A0ABR1B3Z8_POLSC